MNRLEPVYIYADGACRGNPGPGGWGAWIVYRHHELELCGGELDTTNNRMELTAVITALDRLIRGCDVILTVDSKYVMDGATKWMPKWKIRNWTKTGGPIKNLDLWKKLDSAMSRHTITWEWVRGHAGHPGNERADKLANKGLDQTLYDIPS